jgi:hypothetical protein
VQACTYPILNANFRCPTLDSKLSSDQTLGIYFSGVLRLDSNLGSDQTLGIYFSCVQRLDCNLRRVQAFKTNHLLQINRLAILIHQRILMSPK